MPSLTKRVSSYCQLRLSSILHTRGWLIHSAQYTVLRGAPQSSSEEGLSSVKRSRGIGLLQESYISNGSSVSVSKREWLASCLQAVLPSQLRSLHSIGGELYASLQKKTMRPWTLTELWKTAMTPASSLVWLTRAALWGFKTFSRGATLPPEGPRQGPTLRCFTVLFERTPLRRRRWLASGAARSACTGPSLPQATPHCTPRADRRYLESLVGFLERCGGHSRRDIDV